jgi:polar amino acid transport system permease protein
MFDIFAQLLEGFGVTLLIFILTLAISLPLGLCVSFLSMSKRKPIKAITRFFISIIRGTPLMLQLIVIFYGPGLLFGPEYSFKSRFLAVIIAFGINYAAYLSEIFRGGIEAIPKGQYEAGAVLGMTKRQVFFKVILLQVIKHIVPPIGNEIITLVKDTSIARMISLVELTDIAFDLRKAQGGGLWPLLAAGIFYYVFNAVVAYILRLIEKKLSYIKV